MPGPPSAIETTKPRAPVRRPCTADAQVPCRRQEREQGGTQRTHPEAQEPAWVPLGQEGSRALVGVQPASPLPARPSGWGEGSTSLPGEHRRLARRLPPQAAGGQRAGASGTFPESLRSSADTCRPAVLAGG